MREIVYKQCSHMRRGRNTCFNLRPCSLCGGRPIFQLGLFWPVILVGEGAALDNSQSIMSDDFTHSSEYSGLIAVSVLAVLLDKPFVLHSQ